MDPDNFWTQPLTDGVRIYVEVHGRPLRRYVATLQVRFHGGWQTIFLFDNAHGNHDVHGYTGHRKQPDERFEEGDPREVLPKAIAFLVSHWEAILETWKS